MLRGKGGGELMCYYIIWGFVDSFLGCVEVKGVSSGRSRRE